MTSEQQLIEATIYDYLHGIRDTDPDRVAATFHPDAAMSVDRGGAYRVIPGIGAVIANYMRSVPPTLETSPNYEAEIVCLHHRGTAAMVAVEERQLEGKDHITYFILHKIDGQWRIAHKGTWAPV